MQTSRYIQINDWCLIEYFYNTEDNGNLVYFDQTDQPTDKVHNDITDEYSFINANRVLKTHTSKSDKFVFADYANSAVPVNKQKSIWAWAKYDQGLGSKSIWDYPYDPGDDLKIVEKDGNELVHNLTTEHTSGLDEIYYDRVRIHILTSYNLEGLDGIILEPVFDECCGRKFAASQFFYSKAINSVTINRTTSPLVFSQKSYDKYIEFYVPSLAKANKAYWGNTTEVDSVDKNDYNNKKHSGADKEDLSKFAVQYSHQMQQLKKATEFGAGYINKSPLTFNLYELTGMYQKHGCNFYYVKNKFTASIKSSDEFSLLTCRIEEAKDGDYYEYYPMWDGGFMQEYIDGLNAASGASTDEPAWVVMHQITVYEKVGFSEPKKTMEFTSYQKDEFNKPCMFRPILKYASSAVSANLLYTMRLMNTNSNESIVRTSAIGINFSDITKYGKSMLKTNVNSGSKAVNVFNKVVNIKRIPNNLESDAAAWSRAIARANGSALSITANDSSTNSEYDGSSSTNRLSGNNITQEQYVDRNNIALNLNDTRVEEGVQFYGQSQLTIFLSGVSDNIFDFNAYELRGYEFNRKEFHESSGDYAKKLFMTFALDNDDKKEFECLFSSDNNGRLCSFSVKIAEKDAVKILAQTKDRNFYLVEHIIDKDGNTISTSLVYTGMWRSINERASNLYTYNETLIEWIVNKLKEIEEREKALDAREAALNDYKNSLTNYADQLKSFLAALQTAASKSDDADLNEAASNIGDVPSGPSDDDRDSSKTGKNDGNENKTNSSNSDNKNPSSSDKNRDNEGSGLSDNKKTSC